MKIKLHFYSHPNYLTRTAIAREQKKFIKIAFAVHLSAAISAERYRSDSEALKRAVFNFVFFILIKNKIEQSAAQNCLRKKLSLSEIPTDRTFGNRWSRYKELGKKVPLEYTPYGELWTYKSKTAMLFLTMYNNFLAKQPAGLIEEVAAGLDKLPFRFTGKELDEETGLYYYGARYLDPKYSRWLSGDPALNDYMAGSSVGEGGIYNTVNFNVYHYGGNNPVKYIDPDGRSIEAAKAVLKFALTDFVTLDPSDVAIDKKAIAYAAITVFAFIFITTPNQSSEKKAAIEAAVEEIKRKRSKKIIRQNRSSRLL